ncbi:MAG: hypothetical protein KKA79_10095, partial [Nanoarchaeota archaeon]|nr:hypothetical protein [Nanoarchaeota archaeon]
VTPAPPRGLRAIAGNVIKVATEKKSGIIASIIIILVGGLFLFSQFYGGMPGANHLTRAAKFHKKAEKAYTKSKHTKSKKLYKKAQILREEGERRLR